MTNVTVVKEKKASLDLRSWSDIPDGTFFSGKVGTVTGYFVKNRLGVVVVQGKSDYHGPKVESFDNCWLTIDAETYPVSDYSVVDVDVVIKEAV